MKPRHPNQEKNAMAAQLTDARLTEEFAPTVDELQALKRLELGNLPIETAVHDHVPHRLYDLGYIRKNSDGELQLTEKGLALARRQ
jgi:hypothetical protein